MSLGPAIAEFRWLRPPGALKNAIDFLYHEWTDKAAGFIGYGYTMGAGAIESLRLGIRTGPIDGRRAEADDLDAVTESRRLQHRSCQTPATEHANDETRRYYSDSSAQS